MADGAATDGADGIMKHPLQHNWVGGHPPTCLHSPSIITSLCVVCVYHILESYELKQPPASALNEVVE